MKLENKKALVARALNVGKGRIIFNRKRLPEIKEAITKQDIKDLKSDGAIHDKEKAGKKKKRRKHKKESQRKQRKIHGPNKKT